MPSIAFHAFMQLPPHCTECSTGLWGMTTLQTCFHGRWTGKNGPEQTDLVATSTLIKSTPRSIKRFGLISSIGVERYGQLPFNILNLGGRPVRGRT